MSKKVPVKSLSTCSLSELANCIVASFGLTMQSESDSADVTITMIDINSYLEESGATSDIYQDLLRIILGSDYLEASIRFTCLQTLLNESVQHLVTEIFPYSYYDRILQVIGAQGLGLKSLNMKGIWIKEEQMFSMYSLIKKCSHLTRLSIPYIANDELLKEISANSPNLRVIDISGETDITEIGIEHLCYGLSKDYLTVIDIGMLGEENICHTDIALLLQSLPNLTSLMTYSFVGKSLQYIYEKDPSFRSKLKYIHDTGTTLKSMEAIVSTCTDLESIYLDRPVNGILHKLSSLKLRHIKLYKFNSSELLETLELIGGRLVHLTMIKGKGTLDIGKLALSCSGLVDLYCYMMEQLTYTYERKFNGLHGLEILNSPLATKCLKRFICQSPLLKRLAVDTVHFTDEDIIEIFLENEFKYLEDIWFTSATNLSIISVDVRILYIFLLKLNNFFLFNDFTDFNGKVS